MYHQQEWRLGGLSGKGSLGTEKGMLFWMA
jgi:hypothetical protein